MTSSTGQKFPPCALISLIPLVVGSIARTSFASLPSTFGRATLVPGALVARMIAGVTMSMLVFAFQRLTRRESAPDARAHVCKKDCFGDEPGFTAAQGFRDGRLRLHVSCRVFIKSTLDLFFPGLGNDNTVPPRVA